MKFIVGNWKMNGNCDEKENLLKSLKSTKTKTKVVICLPFTLIPGENHGVTLGAQDVSEHDNGAYTGDISGTMLKDAGVKYVLVGHSERRLNHHETNEIVKAKAEMAIKNNLIPIICIGETLDEHKSGKTINIVKEMLDECLPTSGEFIIAYEPRWAIGTGLTPSTEQTAAVHEMIFEHLKSHGLENTPIVYGGSITQSNAGDFISVPHVDGLLIGGASLKSETFLPIIESID